METTLSVLPPFHWEIAEALKSPLGDIPSNGVSEDIKQLHGPVPGV